MREDSGIVDTFKHIPLPLCQVGSRAYALMSLFDSDTSANHSPLVKAPLEKRPHQPATPVSLTHSLLEASHEENSTSSRPFPKSLVVLFWSYFIQVLWVKLLAATMRGLVLAVAFLVAVAEAAHEENMKIKLCDVSIFNQN